MAKVNTKIPQLRFPEFNEKWESIQLGAIGKFSKGKNISKADITENGQYECIRYGELYTIYSEIIDNVISKTNLNCKDLVLSEAGDVIIPASGETRIDIATASCIKMAGIAIGGDINIIKSDAYGIFLAYYLNNKRKFEIASLSQGNSVVHLYAKQLESLELNLPSKLEQQKIADFLTAVDKKIQLLTKKKELLEQYKKGVMQQIFTQQIRFKDENGKDFPKWEEDYAKNYFKSHSNKSHNGKLPILSASQELGMVYRDENGIQIQSSENSIKSYKVVEKGDFVISLRSFQGGIEYSELNGICSPAYVILKPKVPIEDYFYKTYFKKERFINRLSKTVVGIRDGKQISYDAFAGLKILYPSLIEQKKIVALLKAIDSKLRNVSSQTEKLMLWKKGLLQQMFV